MKNKYNNFLFIRQQLIRIISVVLIVLVISNIFIYNSITRLTHTKQLQEFNDRVVSQIGISYETILSNISDIVNKVAIFDFSTYDTSTIIEASYETKMKIKMELDSIVAVNNYIYSINLYIPDTNQVYSNSPNESSLSTIEQFSDSDIFVTDNLRSRFTFLDPRIVYNSRTSRNETLITAVTPVLFSNGTKTSYLAVNLYADKLYNTILQHFDVNNNISIYAYNREGTIILYNTNKSQLYTISPLVEQIKEETTNLELLIHKKNNIISLYNSNYLGWTFVLDSPLEPISYNLTEFIIISFVIVFLVIVIISFFITLKTRPVSKIAQSMSDSLWKDVLLDNITIDDDVISQLKTECFIKNLGLLSVILVFFNQELYDEYELSSLLNISSAQIEEVLRNENINFKLLKTNKNVLSIIINYKICNSTEVCCSENVRLSELISTKLKLENLTSSKENQIFISVSSIQKNIGLLPLCYFECIEALNYKICLNTNILNHMYLKDINNNYEYPTELVRQLINNLTIGNKEMCSSYIEKFFTPILEKKVLIDDTQLINIVFRLQNAILKVISGLPIPVKATFVNNTQYDSLTKIKQQLIDFTNKICDEIYLLDENQEYRLFSAVIDYLDKNYSMDCLSLTKASEDLSLNKNYLSKIVKEVTGNTFNEYVNIKRIAYSKELLEDKNKTIEEISSLVGFSYSYYFIKIFKNIEGITPGQFRNNLIIGSTLVVNKEINNINMEE